MISPELFKAFLAAYLNAGQKQNALLVIRELSPFNIEQSAVQESLLSWVESFAIPACVSPFDPELFRAMLIEYVRMDEILKARRIAAEANPLGNSGNEVLESFHALLDLITVRLVPDAPPRDQIGDCRHAMGIFRFAWILQKLISIRPAIKTIFSWGIGDATFERFLALSLPYSITGFHPNIEVCQKLNTMAADSSYKGKLRVQPSYLDIKDNFDVGIALETLEHFNENEEVEVLRFLRERCRVVFFSVPYGALSLYPPITRAWIDPLVFDESRRERHEHIRAFRPETFRSILERNGFQVLWLQTESGVGAGSLLAADQIVAMCQPR